MNTQKLLVWLVLLVSPFWGGMGHASSSTEEQYNKSCTFCHGTGAAGAPLTGDMAAWEPRLEKGMDALVLAAKKGIGRMPARGMCSTCSDEDFRALIEYMIQK